MVDICEKSLCTGCHACMNICGKKAITMKPNALGFAYPSIDTSLCVDCGLCAKICPVNHPPEAVYPSAVYAAQSADITDLMTSTSGGAASVFSQYVIKQGGVVYGCSAEKISQICHVRIDSLADLYKLKGSKYVQSQIGTVFQEIRSDLKLGRKVLFIGTPCQIAGLNNFLRISYENLITVDLVCHGVPSQQLLLDNIMYDPRLLEDCDVSFRKKGREEQDLRFGIYVKNAKGQFLYSKDYPQDYYIMGFMQGLFYRNSCYTCRWSAPKRCADMTIGDFWGLGNLDNFAIQKGCGVSEVLLNTKKGTAFFNACKDGFNWEEREVEEAIRGNGQLQTPSARHPLYDKFQQLYVKYGFIKSCRKCLRCDYLQYSKRKFREKVVFLLDKIPYARKCYRKFKKILRICLKR